VTPEVPGHLKGDRPKVQTINGVRMELRKCARCKKESYRAVNESRCAECRSK